jgi:hypothetical protein
VSDSSKWPLPEICSAVGFEEDRERERERERERGGFQMPIKMLK